MVINVELIKPSAVAADFLNAGQGIPLFICSEALRVRRKLEEANYKTIGVNSLLSKALLKYPAENRAGYIESE